MSGNSYAIQDGNLIPAAESVISALSSAAAYGDGCFETFRSYSGKFIGLKDHVNRLKQAMTFLGMKAAPEIDVESLKDQIFRLLEANGLTDQDARIRIQVWRLGPLGYKTGGNDRLTLLLTASPVDHDNQPVRLASSGFRRISSASLPNGYKLSNGLNYILARREAINGGYDDALMLDQRSRVSETTIANIFWKKGSDIFTPSETCDILPGITRKVLLQWLEMQDGISVLSGEYPLKDLLQAESVWLTNSVQEIIPVASVDEISFNTRDPFYRELKQAYRGLVNHG